MAKVLILEDDRDVAELVRAALEAEGHEPTIAENCSRLKALGLEDFDLFVLDVVLPDGSGLDIAREIRLSSDAGIVMLTGRATEIDTVLGLEIGADDYIAKPFRPRELSARVKSILRRRGEVASSTREPRGSASVDGWTIDFERREVFAESGAEIPLTPSEFDVLKVLVHRRDQALSRHELVESLRGRGWVANGRLVDGIISRIRAKLAKSTGENPIKTVRGVGYTLVERA
ncbi:response regulator transcription factor [Histidinibacterium aquaticum]|uniref:Response regulator transcription factor n=1 Tax=Histidinibacterium aquaticum TaxID=2613962 RepID=A0A5J5GI00_9RHOB|nr:response regulator transcription factor [Histidinibacterium aquaticum]KAA9007821.1 response regulator transcription factor [Histidinibacterium aquaticum]